MNIAMSYLGVIMIWSTTPLAMKWSTEGAGYLFGVTGRMVIGMAVALVLCAVLRKRFPLDRQAVNTYLAAGTGAYLAMSCSYWGAQYIPSGWISVIFGLSPIMTGFIAALVLGEKSVSVIKTSALCLGLAGLYVMFRQQASPGDQVVYGIAAVMAGTLCHSIGIVMVKKINADISPVASMTGTLAVATTLFLATWVASGSEAPSVIPVKTAASILYLGLVGSVIGFMLFFFVLKHIEATRAALITLITPVSALLLGHAVNDEPLTGEIISGAVLVVAGLLVFQYGSGADFSRIRLIIQGMRLRPGVLTNLERE